MPLTGLHSAELKLILFGGKGGVGKTVCAAATAMELASVHSTLLISTDPAHSVSDCLEQPVGYRLQEIKEVDNLKAIEISADQAFAAFKNKYQAELMKFFDTSTNLDKEDIHHIMSLTIPGIDEIMSFKTIIDLIQEGNFDKYVVDTAPTGHVLRLLSSPALLDEWIKMAAQMRWKYRYMIKSFSGDYQADETDKLLLDLKKTVKRIEGLLKDKNRSEFIVVCTPESMVIHETSRLLANLKKFQITVRQIVVNHVMESDGSTFSVQRRKTQEKYLKQLHETYSGQHNLVKVSEFAGEIKGIGPLNTFRNALF